MINGELTHVAPLRPESNGWVEFEFDWTAPDGEGSFELFAAGVSANGDDGSTGDGAATTSLDVFVADPSNIPSAPPLAQISGPTSGVIKEKLIFDGGGSSDLGVEIPRHS